MGVPSTFARPVPPSPANVISVATAGGDYTSVQAAIDAASSGDVVQVFPGTYAENVTYDSGVKLNGVCPWAAIVNGTITPEATAAQTAPTGGTLRYVDGTSGNDSTGDGSASAPWKTLEKANTSGPSGCTIHVAEGTYDVGSYLDCDVPHVWIADGEVTITAASPATRLVLLNTASAVSWWGFTFDCGENDVYAVQFFVAGADKKFYNCTFTSDVVGGSSPIVYRYSSTTDRTQQGGLFDHCTFGSVSSGFNSYLVQITGDTTAITAEAADGIEFNACTFERVSGSTHCVEIINQAGVVFDGCTFTNTESSTATDGALLKFWNYAETTYGQAVRNCVFNSKAANGYACYVGSETPTEGRDNTLDYFEFTGNTVYGPWYWNASLSKGAGAGNHAFQSGHNAKMTIRDNVMVGCYYAFVIKGDATDWDNVGGLSNNLIVNPQFRGILFKGVTNVRAWGNTLYSNVDPVDSTASLIGIGSDDSSNASGGISIKDSVLCSDNITFINLIDAGSESDTGLVFADNVYYGTGDGGVVFAEGGNDYTTFYGWQESNPAGESTRDQDSVFADPQFAGEDYYCLLALASAAAAKGWQLDQSAVSGIVYKPF